MAPAALAAFVICLQVFISSSYALKCHEGFNMSFNGIPLYYWTERECTGNSKCMGQEFEVDVLLAGEVASLYTIIFLNLFPITYHFEVLRFCCVPTN